MPLYEFFCPVHGDFSEFREVGDCNKGKCSKCKRKFSNFGISVDFRPGWDPGFGKYIDTRRQRDNLLAEKGWIREKIV